MLGIDVDVGASGEVKDISTWIRWSEEEKSRDSDQWMPVHAASAAMTSNNGEADEHLSRVIMYEDIKEYLFSLSSLEAHLSQVLQFIDFFGDLQIAHITFEMLLNITYSKLKPHIKELGEFIAQELELNTSQVNMVKFISSGNDSFTKWSISPAASTDYISNSTAAGIISRLAEHQLQFPVMFGSYEFIGWSVEAKAKWRTGTTRRGFGSGRRRKCLP